MEVTAYVASTIGEQRDILVLSYFLLIQPSIQTHGMVQGMLMMDFLSLANQIGKAPTVMPVGLLYLPTGIVVIESIRLPVALNLHT